MEGCLLDLAKNEVPSLVNLVKKEAQYLCCFNNYVETFDQKRKILAAKHKDMKRDFQKGKGVFSFKYEAEQWESEANDTLDIDTQLKKKLFFGWCPKCWWQYQRGRMLAKKTQHIDELLGRWNSNIIAGRAHVPDLKGISRQDFIHFKSRKSTFEDLMKALQDGNCSMIGLLGMGGAGKTSMAKEVAQKLKESNLIDKVIFLVVSQPPDFKKIRVELAKSLDIPNSESVKEEEFSNTIYSRINNMDKKLLIILDDVWEKFDLIENLGIPNEQRYRGCTLLLTIRNSRVCSEMGCQPIHLEKLTEEDALDLFEKHAKINSSSRGLKGIPQKIVKHCGGVPVAIVAVARALKGRPISFWKDALKTLEEGGVDPNLDEAYQCLKLSYDNLKNQIARELLLVSSMFPEDDEIPIKFLIRIGIGLCSFNENDKYHLKRNEVDGAIMELVYSSLLLKGEEESVKMHDLVREVALKIGGTDIQSLVDLKKPINGNLRYLFWENDGFPDKFDGNELEVLLIFLDDSQDMNVSDTFFRKIAGLKVLILINQDYERIPALSLASSVQPLKDIRTLILRYLELGDISVLGNLLSLRTLWFHECSINELPSEFLKLNQLRSLEVEECEIENNNPFEVIESCSQLEELTFVGNECDSKQRDEISGRVSPLTLHRYCISSEKLSDYSEEYGSMSRCFRIDELSHFVSDATFQQLVARAECLILERPDTQRTWKNLFPDIVPIDKGGILNDLIVLRWSSIPNLECLIDTKGHESGVTAFSNLAELHLFEMSIEDLCRGPPPSSFLEQLEIMKLNECQELKRILPNGNYNLCYLKTIELEDCPKLTSVFQPSTAQSLRKLEKLTIRSCNGLENIIAGQDVDSNQKSCCDPLLPKLKKLRIQGCDKLRILLPILSAEGRASLEEISLRRCEQLEYIFDEFQEGEDAILPSLRELELSRVPSFSGIFREYRCSSMQKPSPLPLSRHNSNKINESHVARAFSWVQACCSLNKSRHDSDGSRDHTNPLELDAPTDGGPPFHRAQSLLVQSLKTVRQIELVECGNIRSLSTLSTAASTMSLENLIIYGCHKLKCIVTNEGDAQVAKKCCSIFPRLETLEIEDCKELKFLFISAISCGLKKLKSLTIEKVPELKYVIGNYQQEQHSSNQNQNEELHFQLLDLETFHIEDAPKINDICTKNFKMVLSSLQKIEIRNFHAKSFDDHNLVGWRTAEERDASIDGDPPLHLAKIFLVQSLEIVREIKLEDCQNLISLSTLSIAASTISLEKLIIRECHKLKCITTNEGDAQVAKNRCSIFPRLETLEIKDCKELEFLFISAVSCGLEKLKSLTIEKVLELKYVIGNYEKEQHSCSQNQMDELCFDLPALETICIEDAPKMNSICPKNYKLLLSSPLNVHIGDCGIKSVTAQELDASIDGVPLFHGAQSFLVHSLKNVREIELVRCYSLISLSTLSIVSLEILIICECHKLKCIATNEGDAQVAKNRCSIFPRLETLEIEDCKELEFLFISAISCGLEKLKSLTIQKVPELKYIVGNYQKEQQSSNQNQMDELHFDLPTLETLCIEDAPKMNSICAKNYKLLLSSPLDVHIRNCSIKSFTTQELYASTDGVHPFHGAQSLLVQSLKTIKGIKLVECYSLISLSTLFIAASTMSLEILIIRECHKLKCFATNEGDAQVAKNHCSIFPRLETLKIEDCKELEFLFISAISCGLEKLKSLTIEEVPELKYVVGNYGKEQQSSNQNQIDELRFDIPALEILYIENAPKMNSICAKNYKLLLSSPLDVNIRNCGIKSFTTQERDASTDGDPPLHLAKILLVQSLETVRKIELNDCQNLISLSTVSIAASTIALENLTICECNKLKCIIAYEDVGTHMSCNSIFPKLKELQVSNCGALEYLFPAFAFRSPSYLESLSIHSTPMLKGMLLHEDILIHENQIKQDPIDFPALSNLSNWDVPQLVSICHENYYLRGLSLRSISLGGFSVRASNEFLVFWHTNQQETKATGLRLQNVERLEVNDSKVEEIFDLTHVDMRQNGDGHEPLTSSLQGLILRNLSELEHICVGPKHIMCFHSLEMLSINSCKKLKVIFSASMVRSLPMLNELTISECEELVYIVEEDYVTNVDDHLCHEPCFPNLQNVFVKNCDKLKYLFSVTLSDTLPKPRDLVIKEAHELEHVLIRRGEMKEMVMKDVLPQLQQMWLVELPNLISICHGIDFRTLADLWLVNISDCPKFSFYETSATKLQTGPERSDSEAKENEEENLSSHQSTEQYLNMGDATHQSLTEKVPIHTSPNLTVLPARGNTQASAKNFEDEEEKEEQGALITSQHPRSGMKASSSFLEEKFETSIDENKTTPNGSKNQDSEVWDGTDQKLSYRSNGRRALETQQTTTGSSNFTRSDELVGKVAPNERRVIDAQQSAKGTQNFTKGELVDKEVKIETNVMEPKSQEEITRHDIQSEAEESEGDGDLIVSCTIPLLNEQTSEVIFPISSKASTSLDQTPQATLGRPVDDDYIQLSDKSHVNDEGVKETNVGEDESMANSSENLGVDPSNLKQMEQESSACSEGQKEHHDVTINSDFNLALNAGVAQKIVKMMRSEGSETSLLEEALNTHPQLCLSFNDRSKQMLCISYRVLIDILGILKTRTPFTITEADKRLLEEKLKDACFLGFNKDWLEYIKTKVFNCDDISEVDGIEEILKGLESDLKSNESMLAATRNQEAEAARVVELAQKDLDVALQEHANVMAKHTHLLKARQHVLVRQNQYWEMISAKNKPFGF